MSDHQPRKIIRSKELKDYLPLGPTQMREHEKCDPDFPKRVPLSAAGRAVGYFVDEVAAYQQKLIERRDQKLRAEGCIMSRDAHPEDNAPRQERRVAEFWIMLDQHGDRRKALPYRLPYADLRVDVILTANEQFTLVEETTTWKRPGPNGELIAVEPPEGGWTIFEDRGEIVRWRRPNTIRFRKRDIAAMMRERDRSGV